MMQRSVISFCFNSICPREGHICRHIQLHSCIWMSLKIFHVGLMDSGRKDYKAAAAMLDSTHSWMKQLEVATPLARHLLFWGAFISYQSTKLCFLKILWTSKTPALCQNFEAKPFQLLVNKKRSFVFCVKAMKIYCFYLELWIVKSLQCLIRWLWR